MKFVVVAGSYEAFLYGYEFSLKKEGEMEDVEEGDLHRQKALAQIEAEGWFLFFFFVCLFVEVFVLFLDFVFFSFFFLCYSFSKP